MSQTARRLIARALDEVCDFIGNPLPSDFTIGPGEHAELLGKFEMEALMLERAPFYFIERAVAVFGEDGVCNTVWGVAPMTEERSAGHFPGRPIVPLIELCKGIAQTGIILASLNGTPEEAPIAISSGPSKAVAKELIEAPVTVVIKVMLTAARAPLFFVDGAAYVDREPIGTLGKVVYALQPRQQLVARKI